LTVGDLDREEKKKKDKSINKLAADFSANSECMFFFEMSISCIQAEAFAQCQRKRRRKKMQSLALKGIMSPKRQS